MRVLLLAAFALFSLFSMSCGSTGVLSTDYKNACAPGVAVIGLTDGSLQNYCGCSEPAGTLAQPPNPITCTVSKGSIVLFQVNASAALRHQIVPGAATGTTIPAGPVYDPSDAHPTVVYAVQFTDTGSFAFQDGIDNSLHGQIVVQ